MHKMIRILMLRDCCLGVGNNYNNVLICSFFCSNILINVAQKSFYWSSLTCINYFMDIGMN